MMSTICDGHERRQRDGLHHMGVNGEFFPTNNACGKSPVNGPGPKHPAGMPAIPRTGSGLLATLQGAIPQDHVSGGVAALTPGQWLSTLRVGIRAACWDQRLLTSSPTVLGGPWILSPGRGKIEGPRWSVRDRLDASPRTWLPSRHSGA